MVIKCPNCASNISEDTIICPECGYKPMTDLSLEVSGESQEPIGCVQPAKCPNCAASIPEGAILCPECGYDTKTIWPPSPRGRFASPAATTGAEKRARAGGVVVSVAVLVLFGVVSSQLGYGPIVFLGPLAVLAISSLTSEHYPQFAVGLRITLKFVRGAIIIVVLGALGAFSICVCFWLLEALFHR
jgi:RNA polymerase subunit RPABC4/transcription elongation factor Spt4